MDTGYVQPMNFFALGSRDMFDANNMPVDYLFRALCQSEFDWVHTEHLACRIWSVLKEAHVGNVRFRLGCMRLTGESTRPSLISPVSPSIFFSEVHDCGEQHDGQCGLVPVRRS
jgi:hypothetical protein